MAFGNTTYWTVLFIGALILFSCRDAEPKNKATLGATGISKYPCTLGKLDRENLLTSLLQLPDFQEFLHPELEGRIPIKLIANSFVTPNLELWSHGKQVTFLDHQENYPQDALELDIEEVDCAAKSFEFSLYYPIEGLTMSGSVKYGGNRWKAVVTQLGED